ncbi:MAG: dihydrofolate reductase [Elusimicrobiota bacterium]
MSLCLIAAMTDEGVIGKNNQLPWKLSEDLKRFKTLTMGHPIIMGRKTFESIGKPLPGRQNIVITRDPYYSKEGVVVVSSLEQALKKSHQDSEDQFIIGGAEIYKLALPQIQKLFLTIIHHPFKGDAFFPKIDFTRDFEIIETSENQSDLQPFFKFTFLTANRKSSL